MHDEAGWAAAFILAGAISIVVVVVVVVVVTTTVVVAAVVVVDAVIGGGVGCVAVVVGGLGVGWQWPVRTARGEAVHAPGVKVGRHERQAMATGLMRAL